MWILYWWLDPACQDINLKHFCYELDPLCQALGNSGGLSDVNNDDRVIMYGLIGGLLVLVILTIVIAGIINEKRWTRWWNTTPGMYKYLQDMGFLEKLCNSQCNLSQSILIYRKVAIFSRTFHDVFIICILMFHSLQCI